MNIIDKFFKSKPMAKTTYTESNVNDAANEHNDLQVELMDKSTTEERKAEIKAKQAELAKSRADARSAAEKNKQSR